MMTRSCPGCGSNQTQLFYELGGVPANSRLLLPSRGEAIALPRGDIALELCAVCGLAFNAAFDPGLAVAAITHDVADTCSPIFTTFQRRLADQLIERYALRDKDIVEIGCGQGELLALLCERGGNHGIGLYADAPGPRAALAGTGPGRRFELFTEDTAVDPTDLVCSKMLLEYVADPARFLSMLHGLLSRRQGARLFLQVSNFTRTLRNFAFWDIHYAHCSYFSPGTLHRLLCAQGFRVGDLWTDFEGEYLMAVTRAADGGAPETSSRGTVETIAELAGVVARFADECRQKQALWCEILRRVAGAGNRIAIWGGGSSAVSFLTTLAVGDEVSYVVDASPFRQGKYTPGTGHQIVAPDVMLAKRPDVVIVMNSVFTSEIQELLASAGCTPTLLIA